MKARLILENGMIFEGNAFGHLKESVGEVVFTTGMTGYQEVLTDPSYYGDRKSTRLNSSHREKSRMPSSA